MDTGAAISCIDDQVAITLGIKPTGTVNGHGMSGASARNLYSVQITIVAGTQQRWNYESPRIMVVDISKQGLIALIGRDFLRNGMMVYGGFSGIVDLSIWIIKMVLLNFELEYKSPVTSPSVQCWKR